MLFAMNRAVTGILAGTVKTSTGMGLDWKLASDLELASNAQQRKQEERLPG
jgi:hypothetical protein